MPSDLELCTTQQLIDELMRRQTFYGVIVHSAEDHKSDAWGERWFKVQFNSHLDAERASRLLDAVAEYMACSDGQADSSDATLED